MEPQTLDWIFNWAMIAAATLLTALAGYLIDRLQSARALPAARNCSARGKRKRNFWH